MNDLKNISLAYFSSVPSFFSFLRSEAVADYISAIVLPLIFFAIGKSIDVGVQIYIAKRRRR